MTKEKLEKHKFGEGNLDDLRENMEDEVDEEELENNDDISDSN